MQLYIQNLHTVFLTQFREGRVLSEKLYRYQVQVPMFSYIEDDQKKRKISCSQVLADKQQQAKRNQTLGSQIAP